MVLLQGEQGDGGERRGPLGCTMFLGWHRMYLETIRQDVVCVLEDHTG